MATRVSLGVVTFSLVAGALIAQPISVGSLPPDANVPLNQVPPPFTAFSLTSPAPQSLIVNSVTFGFSSFPCPGAVKIKFFHPAIVLDLLAERGPFDVQSPISTFSIDPPVSLQKADAIAITVLTDCGRPLVSTAGGSTAIIPGDFVGGLLNSAVLVRSTLALLGTGTATPFNGVGRVIPVVYTGPGAFSSSFRTEILFHNSSPQPASGLLISLVTGPAIRTPFPQPYVVLPGATVAVSSPTSFGSLEIVPAVGPTPAAAVQVSSDVGSAGAVGFAVPAVSPSDALNAGDTASLIGPTDSSNFRFNIGFVALSPAAIAMALRTQNGDLIRTLTLTVQTFAQLSAEQLFGVALGPRAGIDFQVVSGQVLIYGIAADNRTNDGSFQLATR